MYSKPAPFATKNSQSFIAAVLISIFGGTPPGKRTSPSFRNQYHVQYGGIYYLPGDLNISFTLPVKNLSRTVDADFGHELSNDIVT